MPGVTQAYFNPGNTCDRRRHDYVIPCVICLRAHGLFCSLAVLDPRVGHMMYVYTFSIYPCPLSFWLTLPRAVLSTSWCWPSRPCVVFLACMHLALCLAFSLSPGNSLVSSWCEHSMLASLLCRCLFTPALLRTHALICFLCCLRNLQNLFSVLSSQRRQDVFLHSFWVSSFHSCTLLQATLALRLVD